MIGAIITVLFILAVVYIAYRRLPLLSFTAAFTALLLAYAMLGNPAGLWLGLLVILLLCFWLLNLRPLRIVLISGPFMKTYRLSVFLGALLLLATTALGQDNPAVVTADIPFACATHTPACPSSKAAPWLFS